ncbi:uncharacterized protein LOC127081690 [Lathyrus oleraceus]|uniref:uncharacterized protein LOC127081690 n=1 Tax=Pisum sativum TaxID=3888 RepID=UPI0021D15C10|nr:uncharacterized protein LOC127081690 [Pisum sativum]
MQKTNSNIETLRVQALSILCTPHPFLDFSCLSPIQDKVDPCCGTNDQISDDASFDFDNFAFIQDNLDPYSQINKFKKATKKNEEQEFSFACTNVKGMHIFADDIFENGKMRALLPTFDQSLQLFPTINNNASHIRHPLKNIFIKNYLSPQSISSGISKETQNEILQNITMKASSECYEKSNSTGSSNLWRFRQNLDLRSNSDHKDSFVILNPSESKTSIKPNVENIIIKKRKVTAYEKLYVTNKARKGSNKRRSLLPYKHGLFGFFTNMHELSRNLHPF